MAANSVYEVEIYASINGTDGDLQTAWSVPSGATGNKMCVGPALSSTDRTDTTGRFSTHGFTTVVTYGVNSASSAHCRESGTVTTSAAGTFVWQHAQNTSTANATVVGTSSFMRVRKVS
jgi:hypothetical protein